MKRFILIFALVLLVALPVYAAAGTTEHNDWMAPMSLLAVGLVVNAANLKAMFKSFNAIFNEAFAAATPQWPKIAMEVPSTTRSNNYSWMALLTGMREWIGDRHVENLKAYVYELLNKTWEHTIGVPREDIEDDQYGVYNPVVKHQAALAVSHPDELVFGLLNTGFTSLAYDGKTFFATDHAFGSNKATYVLNAENFGKALAALGRLKRADGKTPFYTGGEKFTLVTGPELEGTALAILNNEYISVANGSTQNNIWKGAASYVKSGIITSATAWFIVVEYNTLKPLVFQKRRDPKFTQFVDPDSPEVFKTNTFTFGVDARYNAGYGLPQLAFGSTGLG
jgi:phage major head subunit gpT-like protein